MKKFENAFFLFTFVAVFGLLAPIHAEAETTLRTRFTRPPTDFAFDVQYSYMNIQNYDVAGATDRIVNKAGHRPRVALTWTPFHTSVGTIGLGAGVGFHIPQKFGISSGETVRIYAFPFDLFLSYHARLTKSQWVVPVFRVGPSLQIIRQRTTGGNKTDFTRSGMNIDASGGLQILLNGVDRDGSDGLLRSVGIHRTYLSLEYVISRKLGSSSVDFSHDAFLGGLRFEY